MLKVVVIDRCEYCDGEEYLYTVELEKLIAISSIMDGIAPNKYITPKVATSSNYWK